VTSAPESKGGPGPGRLTVASYNIHKCVGPDGRHLPERTFEVLRELDADVIGIQEFHSRPRRSNGPVEVADFERALGYRALAQRTVASGRGFQANLLLTRLPILGSETIALEFGFYEPRGVLVGDLAAAGGTLRVAVTHLGLWPTVRRRQAARLAAQLRAPGTAPLVLLGDFNEWLPLIGCHRILEARFGPGTRGATWPARRPLLAYDRIWAEPAHCLVETRVHASDLARAASDHLPVRAEIAWGCTKSRLGFESPSTA